VTRGRAKRRVVVLHLLERLGHRLNHREPAYSGLCPVLLRFEQSQCDATASHAIIRHQAFAGPRRVALGSQLFVTREGLPVLAAGEEAVGHAKHRAPQQHPLDVREGLLLPPGVEPLRNRLMHLDRLAEELLAVLLVLRTMAAIRLRLFELGLSELKVTLAE